MRAGKLGVVTEGALTSIGDAERVGSEERLIDGEERTFTRALSTDATVQATLSNAGRIAAATGHALCDVERERETYSERRGIVRVRETTQRHRLGTRFAAVTDTGARSGFALCDSGAGTFAFDFLAAAQDHCRLEPADIDLAGWLTDHPGYEAHQVGRNEYDEDGTVSIDWFERAVSHDRALALLNRTEPLTLDVTSTDEQLRVFIAQSGWIEVYAPSDIETAAFLEFVGDEILPYASVAEENAQQTLADVGGSADA